MDKKQSAADRARALLLNQYQGTLSTLSVEVAGYPFGSVVPYCTDRRGRPAILISTIAQHTKNILADSRVSLLASAAEVADAQAHGRVTYLGNAVPLDESDEDTPERYYRFFPESRGYHKTHDFNFYVIEGLRVRYIGGFGDINWIDINRFLRENPFSAESETGAVDHMNADHADAMVHYCRCAGIALAAGQQPVMAGVDGEGFHLRTGKRIHRFTFEEPVGSSEELRARMVEMARRPEPLEA